MVKFCKVLCVSLMVAVVSLGVTMTAFANETPPIPIAISKPIAIPRDVVDEATDASNPIMPEDDAEFASEYR